jgi:alpha-ketoglutaric semialdehyde dehydrogenase
MQNHAEEINQVMSRSYAAFCDYRKISGNQKADFLDGIAAMLEQASAALVAVATTETNLPEARLSGERMRTCNQLRQFSAMLREGSWVDARIDTAQPERQPLPKPDVRKMNVALGPVVVFGASNFPFAYSTAGVDTAAALAAGCSVVLRGHPAHPKTSLAVAELISQAAHKSGIPKDTFIHVDGPGFEIGKLLVQHPQTKAVGFTGSYSGGKALYDYAQQRPEPIPVFSEMGSINPVYLLPESLKSLAAQTAEQYSVSITQSVGQFCTNPGLIIGVERESLRNFITLLSDKLKQIPPARMLHEGISKSFYHKRAQALKQKGVDLVAMSVSEEPENYGVPTLATVSADDFLNNPGLHDEVFGPYSLIVRAKDIKQMQAIAENLPGQLTSTAIGLDAELSEHQGLLEAIASRAGRIILNGVPTGVEVCPSMHHGGPFPATTDSRFSSVGIDAVKRFVRPLSFQNYPESLLPDELKTSNPLEIWRLFNNELRK